MDALRLLPLPVYQPPPALRLSIHPLNALQLALPNQSPLTPLQLVAQQIKWAVETSRMGSGRTVPRSYPLLDIPSLDIVEASFYSLRSAHNIAPAGVVGEAGKWCPPS